MDELGPDRSQLARLDQHVQEVSRQVAAVTELCDGSRVMERYAADLQAAADRFAGQLRSAHATAARLADGTQSA